MQYAAKFPGRMLNTVRSWMERFAKVVRWQGPVHFVKRRSPFPGQAKAATDATHMREWSTTGLHPLRGLSFRLEGRLSSES